MSILLLGILFCSSQTMGTAQPTQSLPHAMPLVTQGLTSNTTITCFFNEVEYFVSSPSANPITCQGLLRDATMSVANSGNDRSVTDILWSCLATVFACTWVSVHPNIPHPDATEWQIRRHRVLMMLCGLVAPELIVLWALRQWFGARSLVQKMREKNIQGFTMVHAHFMQMGGFMVYANGARVGVIKDYNRLVSCIMEGNFILPTAEEIQDRSKGDGLSKALVVGQTGWFMAQCLSRWVAGLAMTEIELVTVAFAALNGIIYSLWWSKPLDVRYAVQVVRPNGDRGLNFDELPFATSTLSSVLSRDSRGRRRIDDLQGIRHILANSRLGRFISIMKPHFSRGDEERVDKHLRISILHSNCDSLDTFAATIIASIVGILFGAVHCTAWHFNFLSQQELILWHVWSTIITTVPTFLAIKSAIGYLYLWSHYNHSIAMGVRTFIFTSQLSMWAIVLAAPAYVVARVGLLVQALIALRDLRPAERAQVQWVNFLPHL